VAVTFLTGHEDPTKGRSDIDWDHLAGLGGTIVFYMGVRRMEENLNRLIAGGRPADTPAAIVEWGTYPRQRTLTGTLGTIAASAAEAGIGAPALVVVGEVVELRERLAWFEARPLFGRRVLVTRARAQASGFAADLQELGAEVVQFPTIRVAPPADPEPLRRAVREIERYDWVVFTSVNGVEYLWEELRAAGRDTRSLAGVSLCAIGPATAAALELHGARADLMPEQFVSEAAVAAMAGVARLAGARILLPRADIAREALPRLLRAEGAVVDEVDAYRTVLDDAHADEMRDHVRAGGLDLITFTASSTVRNFVKLFGTEVGAARVASIGPITSATARELGLQVDIEAEEYTIPGLVRAIVAALGVPRDSLPS
jgi:uroporphyrinogen III methyltransferase / synthase